MQFPPPPPKIDLNPNGLGFLLAGRPTEDINEAFADIIAGKRLRTLLSFD